MNADDTIFWIVQSALRQQQQPQVVRLPQQAPTQPRPTPQQEKRERPPRVVEATVLTRKPTVLRGKDLAIVRLPASWLKRVGAEKAYTAVVLEDRIVLASTETIRKLLTGAP